jgi:hypothetical protein
VEAVALEVANKSNDVFADAIKGVEGLPNASFSSTLLINGICS